MMAKIAEAQAAEKNAVAALGAAHLGSAAGWIGVLRGRCEAAKRADDAAQCRYLQAQIVSAEAEAASVAAQYGVDPASAKAAEVSPPSQSFQLSESRPSRF